MRAQPTLTERSTSSAGKVALRCLAAFLAAAAAVYGWGRVWAERATVPTESQATAVVRHAGLLPSNANESAQACRQIEATIGASANITAALQTAEVAAAPEELEAVNQRLTIEASAAPSTTDARIAITCSDRDPVQAAAVANALAEHYAAGVVRQWDEAAKLTTADAEKRVKAALQAFDEAQGSLDAYLEEKLAETQRAAAEPPKPDDFSDLSLMQRLEVLMLRRASLLADRTASHPAVQELDAEIESLEEQVARATADPAGVPDLFAVPERPAPLPPPSPTEMPEYFALAEGAALARSAYEAAAGNVLGCRAAMNRRPPVELGRAVTMEVGPATATAVSWPLAGLSLAGGLTAAFSVWLFSRRPRETVVTSAEQLERLLGVPVVALE